MAPTGLLRWKKVVASVVAARLLIAKLRIVGAISCGIYPEATRFWIRTRHVVHSYSWVEFGEARFVEPVSLVTSIIIFHHLDLRLQRVICIRYLRTLEVDPLHFAPVFLKPGALLPALRLARLGWLRVSHLLYLYRYLSSWVTGYGWGGRGPHRRLAPHPN